LLAHHAQEVFRYQPLDFSIHLAEEIRDVRISASFRRDFYLILKETLHNISRHSGATAVYIEFGEKNGELNCRIRDDGCGFDPATISRGNGLKNMARRAKLIGGKLLIDTRPGGGTVVHLNMPLSGARRWKLWASRLAKNISYAGEATPQSNALPEFASGTSRIFREDLKC
jgi:signal transduction histidine kinase